MTIRYGFTLTNPALPQVKSYGETLRNLPGLTEWFQADDGNVDFRADTSYITSWRSLKASARTLEQTTTTKQAALTANQLNGYPAASFDRLASNFYSASSAPAASGQLAFAIIFKPTQDAMSQGIISMFSTTTTRFGADISPTAGFVAARCGATSTFAPFVPNAWNVLIFEKDMTALQIRSNGVSIAQSAHNNETGSGILTIGALSPTLQPLAGYISDIFIFNQRIIAAPTVMKALGDYAESIYGLSV